MAAHQIYVHLAWTTRDRQPMIDRATRDFLGDYWRRTAIRERAEIVVLAILRTHVHLLVRTAPRFDLPRLVQFLKGGSSYAASRLPGNMVGLRWSREYSATTVSPKQLAGVIRYIEDQSRRHPGEAVEEAEPNGGSVGRVP
jgi:REP-associated tyrosine transposase